MNKCKKNILLIFGYLLFVAFLIVPYSSFSIEKKRLPDFSQWEKEQEKKGLKPGFPPCPELFPKEEKKEEKKFVLPPFPDLFAKEEEKKELESGLRPFSDYFKPTNYEKVVIIHRKSGWVFSPYMLISKRHFFINWNTLAVETAVILLIAGFSYILFCIVLKKGNK